MAKQIQNSIIMIILFFIGIFIVFEAFQITSSMKSNCKSNPKITKLINWLIILGTTCIVSSASFLIFYYTCDSSNSNKTDLKIFLSIMFILGISLITLGSMISKESNKKDCKIDNGGTTGSGVLIIVVILTYLGYKWYLSRKNKSDGGKLFSPANKSFG